MGYSVKKNIKVGVKKEVTEGVYEAPLGEDFIQAQEDGIELSGSRDTLEINVIGTGLSKVAPRVGLESATGTLGMYMKAAGAPTDLPEYNVMMESLMGSKRLLAAPITTGTGHTVTTINVSDTSSLEVGDIVVIQEAGVFHTSPIVEVITDTSIELLVALASAPADAVEIEAFTSYVPADEGHPSYSVSKYVEDSILEQAVGCKTTSLSLESFTTGQIASMKFGFEGANYGRSIDALAVTPSYDDSETPIILDACIWQNGVKIGVNEFTLSVENTLGWIKNTCEGKISSRVTDRSVSGTINPYKADDNVANFTMFDTNSPFSLFVTAHNPTATGEFAESVSFYVPQCTITELGEADIDGVLTETINFSATSEEGVVKEVYISVS